MGTPVFESIVYVLCFIHDFVCCTRKPKPNDPKQPELYTCDCLTDTGTFLVISCQSNCYVDGETGTFVYFIVFTIKPIHIDLHIDLVDLKYTDPFGRQILGKTGAEIEETYSNDTNAYYQMTEIPEKCCYDIKAFIRKYNEKYSLNGYRVLRCYKYSECGLCNHSEDEVQFLRYNYTRIPP